MSSPHDALFKYVFSQPEHAASELRAILPSELSKRIDWGSLELSPASFVDERLSGRQADVLFTLRCQGRKAYLYVLLEHQSTPEALMAFRLLRYVVRIWETFLIEHPESVRIPAIIPVVVHHSQRGWTAATDLCSLIDADAETLALLAGYIPAVSVCARRPLAGRRQRAARALAHGGRLGGADALGPWPHAQLDR